MTKFMGLTAGVDMDGEPVRLGERDSMGHVIGYIDEDTGSCWESLQERDCSVTAGRYDEALVAWRKAGSRGAQPDPEEFARQLCKDPANWERAAKEAREQSAFYEGLRRQLGIIRTAERDDRLVVAHFLSWLLNADGVQIDTVDDLMDAFQRFRLERWEDR